MAEMVERMAFLHKTFLFTRSFLETTTETPLLTLASEKTILACDEVTSPHFSCPAAVSIFPLLFSFFSPPDLSQPGVRLWVRRQLLHGLYRGVHLVLKDAEVLEWMGKKFTLYVSPLLCLCALCSRQSPHRNSPLDNKLSDSILPVKKAIFRSNSNAPELVAVA